MDASTDRYPVPSAGVGVNPPCPSTSTLPPFPPFPPASAGDSTAPPNTVLLPFGLPDGTIGSATTVTNAVGLSQWQQFGGGDASGGMVTDEAETTSAVVYTLRPRKRLNNADFAALLAPWSLPTNNAIPQSTALLQGAEYEWGPEALIPAPAGQMNAIPASDRQPLILPAAGAAYMQSPDSQLCLARIVGFYRDFSGLMGAFEGLQVPDLDPREHLAYPANYDGNRMRLSLRPDPPGQDFLYPLYVGNIALRPPRILHDAERLNRRIARVRHAKVGQPTRSKVWADNLAAEALQELSPSQAGSSGTQYVKNHALSGLDRYMTAKDWLNFERNITIPYERLRHAWEVNYPAGTALRFAVEIAIDVLLYIKSYSPVAVTIGDFHSSLQKMLGVPAEAVGDSINAVVGLLTELGIQGVLGRPIDG